MSTEHRPNWDKIGGNEWSMLPIMTPSAPPVSCKISAELVPEA